VDVREEVREAVKCFFPDLWRLNGDRPRGEPSKEYLVRLWTRDLLVASYVVSYDVSSNPTVAEGESIHSFQEDHVDVTNWMDLLNRSVTTHSPVNPSDYLFG
jgi:hypothetical protein